MLLNPSSSYSSFIWFPDYCRFALFVLLHKETEELPPKAATSTIPIVFAVGASPKSLCIS